MSNVSYTQDSPHIPPGERIRFERVKRGMTQEQLANNLGISGSYISAVERGERSLSSNLIQKLHAFFGMSYDYILDGKLLPDVPYPGIIYDAETSNVYHRFEVLLGTCNEVEATTCYQMCHSYLSSIRKGRL